MTHILTAEQFSKKELLQLFEAAKKLQKAKKIPQTMKGKILATVFLEPSTRTRLSFETAMLKLGGQVISIPNAESSFPLPPKCPSSMPGTAQVSIPPSTYWIFIPFGKNERLSTASLSGSWETARTAEC